MSDLGRGMTLTTNTGKSKAAARRATGDPWRMSHIAFGTGDRVPSGGEISLQNETERRTIMASGVDPENADAAFFDIMLAPADGPFVIHEAGLIDEDGELIAISRYDPPVEKITGSDTLILRITTVFGSFENLNITISSSTAYVDRQTRVDTGDGLIGGGDLQASRALAVDGTVARTSLQAALAANQADLITRQMAQEIRLRTLEHKPTANMETAL